MSAPRPTSDPAKRLAEIKYELSKPVQSQFIKSDCEWLVARVTDLEARRPDFIPRDTDEKPSDAPPCEGGSMSEDRYEEIKSEYLTDFQVMGPDRATVKLIKALVKAETELATTRQALTEIRETSDDLRIRLIACRALAATEEPA